MASRILVDHLLRFLLDFDLSLKSHEAFVNRSIKLDIDGANWLIMALTDAWEIFDFLFHKIRLFFVYDWFDFW